MHHLSRTKNRNPIHLFLVNLVQKLDFISLMNLDKPICMQLKNTMQLAIKFNEMSLALIFEIEQVLRILKILFFNYLGYYDALRVFCHARKLHISGSDPRINKALVQSEGTVSPRVKPPLMKELPSECL